MKYWEIIADRLCNAGWSLGWVSALDLEGRTIWIVDAHGYGKRFVVRADEKLTAFVECHRRSSHSLVSDLHEFRSLSGSGINHQDISNARGVEFVFEGVGV